MTKRLTERRLVDVLVSHLREHHCTGREVRHYEKNIDVVMICSKTDEVWAVEAKVAAWERAISQAIVNLSASERSYIAMYAGNAHRVPLEILDNHGIGLFAVGPRWGEVRIIHEARRSQYTNRLAVERIRTAVKKGSGK